MKILRLLGFIGCILLYSSPALILLVLFIDISAPVFWGGIGFNILCASCIPYFTDDFHK